MSSTRIEENKKEQNLPLALDSGASDHQAVARTTSYDRRNQSNEIWIAEFKNEFERLVSIGSLQQQEHPSAHREHLTDRFMPYPRTTTHVCHETSHRTRITAADNSTHWGDISAFYLHLPIRTEQQRRPTDYNYCHIHGQEGSHNANQCRNESVCH